MRVTVALTPAHDLASIRRSLPPQPAQLDAELWRAVQTLLLEYEQLRALHAQILHQLSALGPSVADLRQQLNQLHRQLAGTAP